MQKQLDLLLINAPGKENVYQSLSNELAAYEPPIWAALIAQCIRDKKYSVSILDAEALQLTYQETIDKIIKLDPLLLVFVVYGQQPSASTQCMPSAIDLHSLLKRSHPSILTMFLGTHPSALPHKTLEETAANFVCEGEGPNTIASLLPKLKNNEKDFKQISGLWFKLDGKIIKGPPSPNILDLDKELPGMAWDLLPMDKYRAHNWHCWEHINDRGSYASLYTSLGCPFKCNFCCINAPFGGASIRYFSLQWTIKQLDILVQKYHIKNIKIADEMFILNKKHVLDICDYIIAKGYKLNIWAYARVDTVNEKLLTKLKQAGFNWLGLGIESGSKLVRDSIEKGKFQDTDIRDTIKRIQDHGIYIGANYIFGLPNDNFESMKVTLDLAIKLNTEWANFYSSMPYPGSLLHKRLDSNSPLLPENNKEISWLGYSQHSKQSYPLATKLLSSQEILAFRDYAFNKYFTGERYLSMMQEKFDDDVIDHIQFMTSHKLVRNNSLSQDKLFNLISCYKK